MSMVLRMNKTNFSKAQILVFKPKKFNHRSDVQLIQRRNKRLHILRQNFCTFYGFNTASILVNKLSIPKNI